MKRKKRKSTVRRHQAGNTRAAKGQIRDANSRTIFQNSMLVSQFLRDNFDIPILEDVKPEDIEDVTKRYQAYLGISFETDTVQRIRLRNIAVGTGIDTDADAEQESQIYLVSLIEHKSEVDYNVTMQLLRYMSCIWNECAREAEQRQEGITRTKAFKYPAILPIVYYEGSGNWTADLRFQDRILLKEVFGDYIPDFTYRMVRIHDYSNEELLDREDEMSLLMMINKVQTPEDMTRFLKSERDKIARIISKAPAPVLNIIASTIWSLCIKMNMPVDEARECVKEVEDRNMGYLFENMEKMDIQAERRKTKEAEQKLAEAERTAEQRATQVREELTEKIKEKELQLENGIKSFVQLCQEFHMEKENATARLIEKYDLSRADAENKIQKYWN